jgi:hypothetical protein
MEEREQHIEALVIQYLIEHTQCSGCGERYEPEDVHVRHHRGHIWLASLTCRMCGLRGLVMANIQIQQDEEVPGTEEPAEQEQVLKSQPMPISADEVLDMHCFLQGFHGDLMQFLSQHK